MDGSVWSVGCGQGLAAWQAFFSHQRHNRREEKGRVFDMSISKKDRTDHEQKHRFQARALKGVTQVALLMSYNISQKWFKGNYAGSP